MRSSSRIEIRILFLTAIACVSWSCRGTYGDDDPSSLSEPNAPSATGIVSQSIRVLNSSARIAKYEYRVDLGGSCDSGDAKYNCVQAKMSRNGVAVKWANDVSAIGCPPSGIRSRCENGRFSIVIPKPADSALCGGTNDLEYQVQLQMFTSPDNSTWTEGQKSPVFTFAVQRIGTCSP